MVPPRTALDYISEIKVSSSFHKIKQNNTKRVKKRAGNGKSKEKPIASMFQVLDRVFKGRTDNPNKPNNSNDSTSKNTLKRKRGHYMLCLTIHIISYII